MKGENVRTDSFQVPVGRSDETVVADVWWRDGRDRSSWGILVPGQSGRCWEEYGRLFESLVSSFLSLMDVVVVFSCRGQDESTGSYSYEAAYEDLCAVREHMKSHAGLPVVGPPHLYGRSASTAIVSRYAAERKEDVQSVILWGASTYESWYSKYYVPEHREDELDIRRRRGVRFAADFFEKLFYPEDFLPRVECPVLLCVPVEDPGLDVHQQLDIGLALADPHSEVRFLTGIPHTYQREEHIETVDRVMREWLAVVRE